MTIGLLHKQYINPDDEPIVLQLSELEDDRMSGFEDEGRVVSKEDEAKLAAIV